MSSLGYGWNAENTVEAMRTATGAFLISELTLLDQLSSAVGPQDPGELIRRRGVLWSRSLTYRVADLFADMSAGRHLAPGSYEEMLVAYRRRYPGQTLILNRGPIKYRRARVHFEAYWLVTYFYKEEA